MDSEVVLMRIINDLLGYMDDRERAVNDLLSHYLDSYPELNPLMEMYGIYNEETNEFIWNTGA